MRQLIRKLQGTEWTIALLENSLESIVRGEKLHYSLMKYKNKDAWYADPFVLDVNDKEITLLAEEMLYSMGYARISKLVINRKTTELSKVTPLLTLPTHLSYPAILRSDKGVFVYPESGKSGKLTRYFYDNKNERLIEQEVIMEGPLADATILSLHGQEFLFCTLLPDCNGKELFIYRKESNRWHLFQKYVFDENVARMAGDFFWIGDTLYRPAQDCNKSYGNGLVIQKVELNDGKFLFTETARYYSEDYIYKDGIHTLNSFKDVVVADFVGKPRFPIAKFIINCLKRTINYKQ